MGTPLPATGGANGSIASLVPQTPGFRAVGAPCPKRGSATRGHQGRLVADALRFAGRFRVDRVPNQHGRDNDDNRLRLSVGSGPACTVISG